MFECLFCIKFNICPLFKESFEKARIKYPSDNEAIHQFVLDNTRDCKEYIESVL